MLPETWANVIKICRVLGVRPEVGFITQATNDDGDFFVSPRARPTTPAAESRKTDPRWLEAVAVDGTTFGLVEDGTSLLPPP